MMARAIKVGGIYEVSVQGFKMHAEVVRELGHIKTERYRPSPKAKKPGSNLSSTYEVRLTQKVGHLPKGHLLTVKARSFKALVKAPENGGIPAWQEAAKRAREAQRAVDEVITSHNEQQEKLANQPPEVIDRFKMGVPIDDAVKPEGKFLGVMIRAVLPVEDVATVFNLLDDAGYRPSLTIVGPTSKY